MIHGITYTDDKMTRSAQLCWNSMKNNGFDSAKIYHPDEISADFISMNPVLHSERGCGYWLWKPYFINQVISMMQDGDILVWSDAGCEWIENPRHIIDVMDASEGNNRDIFLFSNGHQHVHWTKADILKAILHENMISDHYQQVQASVIFIRVSDFSRRFIKEWLLYCQMPGLIDDLPSVLPNHPEFAENRHDQAILSTLAIRYGLTLHWWPDAIWYQSQQYRWPNDKYPPMLRHHRKRNNEW